MCIYLIFFDFHYFDGKYLDSSMTAFLNPTPDDIIWSSRLFVSIVWNKMVIRWLESWQTFSKAVCPVTPRLTACSGISCVQKIRQHTELSFSVTYGSATSFCSQWTLLGRLLMTFMSPFQIWGCVECYWTAMWLRLSSQIHLQSHQKMGTVGLYPLLLLLLLLFGCCQRAVSQFPGWIAEVEVSGKTSYNASIMFFSVTYGSLSHGTGLYAL